MLRQKTLQITAEEFEFVRAFMRERSGVVIDAGKQYLVEFRLAPIVAAHEYATINDLFSDLKAGESQQLRRAVIDALTTNETAFFRDVRPFEALRHVVVPSLVEARSEQRALRIWSAGCSSGQEPYSALLVLRQIEELAQWRTSVLATDVSSEMVNRAREGRYAQIEVNRGLPPAMLQSYFEPDGVGWKVKDELRRGLEFRCASVLEPMPDDGPFDVVFIRNVFNSFYTEGRSSLLDYLTTALASDGFLFVGAAEACPDLHPAFAPVEAEKACCYRRV
jgi:chemotaxis protein methyltransferase CheR